jgi:hypothetical protein
MTQITIEREALDLALEALEKLTDTEQTYEALDLGDKAITAIKQVRALDKKAENARELGLDYGPVTTLGGGLPVYDTPPVQEPVANGMKEQARELATRMRKETSDLKNWDYQRWAAMLQTAATMLDNLTNTPPAPAPAPVCIGWDDKTDTPVMGYTTPPAPVPVPLTNTEFGEQWFRQTGRIMGTDKQLLLQAKRVTEAAHGITEKGQL